MKTERELFLYELNGHGYHFKNTDWHDDWERFEDDQLNMAWEMWCASASREGYKLVPVESTKEHIHKFEEITVNGDDARKYICIYCGFEKSESFNDH